MQVTASLLTASAPGAIAVIGLFGEVEPLLARLAAAAGRHGAWPVGQRRLLEIKPIDEAVVIWLDPARALLMPHGGPWVVRRMLEHLATLGATLADPQVLEPRWRYPEAADHFEARVLAALARTESPLAIELLLDQPRRWQSSPGEREELLRDPATLARSARLDRLLDPPRVALVGPPNVGKSSLTNRLAGREVAIVADQPGTTRDSVGCHLLLGGVAVAWQDTPGLRETCDPLERQGVALSARLIEECECVLAITDAGHDWPALPRTPDLRIGSRCDLGRRGDVSLHVSAVTGEGIAELVAAIRETLIPSADLAHPGPWVIGGG
jgi:hypothetical protein